MTKIRIIDLLNKIANDRKIPERIKFNGYEYRYHDKEHGYCKHHYDNTYICLNSEYYLFDILNDEVEIIEEDKEIEKISLYYRVPNDIKDEVIFDTLCEFIENQRKQEDKINELIDKVNSLENKDV